MKTTALAESLAASSPAIGRAAAPSITPVAVEPRPRVRLLHYEPRPGEDITVTPLDPQNPPEPAHPVEDPAPDPEAAAAVTRILRLGLEVLDGRRPLDHLGRHLGPAALRYWRAATTDTPIRHAASRLHRVVLGHPCPDVTEVAAVCVVRGRTRALAARFEATGAGPPRWRCTVLRLG